MRLQLLYILLIAAVSFNAKAAHIVGGDMYYECIGTNQYRITLKVYRDCFSNGPNVADYDDPAFIGIFDANGNEIDILNVFFQNRRNVPPETSNPCLSPPSNVCVEEASYVFDYTLPPVNGGYTVVYTRCCRNATIGNIVAPGSVGATYTVNIDPQRTPCNNSPEFNDFPPIVICAGEPLVFDHSATDPDGDVIEYELCAPFTGGDQNDPQPFPTPPPFGNVTWQNPYSIANLLGGTPLTIDRNTGILTGTPQLQGQFVVGVCANEYRNGVLIGTTRRDFQFNVVSCIVDVEAIIPVIDTTGVDPGIGGVYLNRCLDLEVPFANNSRGGRTYFWDFGVPGITDDTSDLFSPTYTYADTGEYVVTLVVNPRTFCSDTFKVLVRLYPQFFSEYDFANVCQNTPLTFTDQSFSLYGIVNQWSWQFGDNTSSTQQNPIKTYTQDGIYQVRLITNDTNECIDTVTKTVTIFSTPDVDFDITPACQNSPIVFTDNTVINFGDFDNRNWVLNGTNIGSINPYIYQEPNLGQRTMTLVVASEQGCVDSLTKTYTVFPPPTVTVTNDTALCIFDTIRLNATGGAQYVWSPASGLSSANLSNPFASPAQTTAYTVNVTDSNGCVNTGSVNVTVNPLPETSAGADNFVCIGDTFQLNGQNGVSFSWQPDSLVSNPTIANPTTSPDSSTTFVLTTLNQFGCDNTDTMFLEVQRPINATLAAPPDVCIFDTIQLEVQDGKYYQWIPSAGLSSDTINNPTASPLETTSYTVIVTNDCPQFADTLDIEIVVRPLPEVDAGIDTTVFRDESTMLLGSSNGISFVWSPADYLDDSTILNPISFPFNSIDYILTATSEFDCKNSDTVTVNVEVKTLLLVPNAFTPNQDGLNDVFRIIKTLNIERVYDVFVFNRWGNKVFEGHDENAFWDGTVNGRPADLGVYVYIIRAVTRDGDEVTETGNVTLLR